ncbi:MAG TPA: hypothetical protein DHM90_09095 [Clostridiaceae bacterium]|nr:hypothetical protein [Clostridiaceae bacterium]
MKKYSDDFETYLTDIYADEFKKATRKKPGTWNWIKREIFFAEEMSNKEFLQMIAACAVMVPVVIVFVWLIFAAGYALQGSWPW